MTQSLIDIYGDQKNDNPEILMRSEALTKPGSVGIKITVKTVDQIVNDLKQKIGSNLTKRHGKYNENKLFMIATMIDPRYKDLGFENEEDQEVHNYIILWEHFYSKHKQFGVVVSVNMLPLKLKIL